MLFYNLEDGAQADFCEEIIFYGRGKIRKKSKISGLLKKLHACQKSERGTRTDEESRKNGARGLATGPNSTSFVTFFHFSFYYYY
jgi:hypothetical protein